MNKNFSEVLSTIQQISHDYTERPLPRQVFPSDDMVNTSWDHEKLHYFGVGLDALELIFDAMMLCRLTKIRSILDMPSGFGRVTRHLKTAFPDAELYACDLYQDRIDFCARELGAIPVKSKENFNDIRFTTKFDLIWCGSLLTHLTAQQFQQALELFARSLNADGVAVITLHGRHSPFIQHNKWKYLPDEQFAIAESQFRDKGFGYADYNMQNVFFEQETYGVCLSSPSYVLKCLEKDESIRIKAYLERRWDDHQDALIFQKTPLNL
jgi:SAM-dependent methyltransferase